MEDVAAFVTLLDPSTIPEATGQAGFAGFLGGLIETISNIAKTGISNNFRYMILP